MNTALKSGILIQFVLLFFGTSLFAQEKVHWMNLDEVQIAMKKEPRKVLIDVYTNWCGPCKMMMSQTFTNAEVISYINKNYYAVKFNGEGADAVTFKGVVYLNSGYNSENANRRNSTHDFTRAIATKNGKIMYPTIVYMDENLQIISPVQGFFKAPQFIPLLHFIHDEAYKQGIVFNTYMTNYNAK